METETCPNCDTDLRDQEIPKEYVLAGYYGPWKEGDPPKYYSRRIGFEVPGVYDGVLFWGCPDCGHLWNRWSPKSPLYADAQEQIRKHVNA